MIKKLLLFEMKLFLLLIAFCFFTCGEIGASEKLKRPNIVIILADDLGWGDLSCQGAKDMQTPHLDALFKAGMTFDRFYANSSVCSPTRAALLTGRYPELVGVPGVIRTHENNSWGYLSPEVPLLPELLRQAGYHTGMVGKWHLGLSAPNLPTLRGFDHFHGFLGDMMDDYWNHRRHGNNYMRLGRKTIDPKGHATDLFSQWAVHYIQEQAKTKQPFFLYLAYNAPHDPIQPPPEWLNNVNKRETKISEKRAKLVALIEHMDAGIGQVIEALKDAGVYDNTLILFTSDNGGALHHGAFNGPLRNGKGSMYEGGLRVPMCAVWSKHIQPGSRCDEVALTMDLYPTACEAGGAQVKHKIDGVSLLPLVLGKSKTLPKRDVFFIRKEGGRYKGKNIYAMRRGEWKLVQNLPGAPLELYHLKSDPLEKKDLSQSHRDKFQELSTVLREHIRQGELVPWQPPEKRKGNAK